MDFCVLPVSLVYKLMDQLDTGLFFALWVVLVCCVGLRVDALLDGDEWPQHSP